MSTQLRVNPLPSPTWRWLKLNDAVTEVDFTKYVALQTTDGHLELSENLHEHTKRLEEYDEYEDGLGEVTRKILKDAEVLPDCFELEKAHQAEAKFQMTFQGENSLLTEELDFLAKEDSDLTIYMDFASKGKGQALLSTKIKVEKNARVRLVQIHRIGEDFQFFNNVSTRVEDFGNFELIHIFLTGNKVYIGACTELFGKESNLKIDTGYQVKGSDLLDINYVARHKGYKTNSEITVNGVLKDQAKKTFRGTIDFIYGSDKAIGNEVEDVLLLDQGVTNKTVPVILCEEEDVQGNHGATIGRIGEDLIYYLSSRGMKEEEIYKMMAQGRLMTTIHLIENEEIRKELTELVLGKEEE